MKSLEITSVTKHFGGILAVDAASFQIHSNEIIALIGPNGSGKTTLVNLLSGFAVPSAGDILLDGRSIAGRPPDKIARMGIVRTFQHARLFVQLTTMDNLLIAGQALGLTKKATKQRAEALLDELELQAVAGNVTSALSGGQRKLLEFGMCFIGDSQLVLLDEPFSAIHPRMKKTLASFIGRRRNSGRAILMVSHDMPVVAELCSRTICMNAGQVIADGPTNRVLNHRDVIEAYLGAG